MKAHNQPLINNKAEINKYKMDLLEQNTHGHMSITGFSPAAFQQHCTRVQLQLFQLLWQEHKNKIPSYCTEATTQFPTASSEFPHLHFSPSQEIKLQPYPSLCQNDYTQEPLPLTTPCMCKSFALQALPEMKNNSLLTNQ